MTWDTSVLLSPQPLSVAHCMHGQLLVTGQALQGPKLEVLQHCALSLYHRHHTVEAAPDGFPCHYQSGPTAERLGKHNGKLDKPLSYQSIITNVLRSISSAISVRHTGQRLCTYQSGLDFWTDMGPARAAGQLARFCCLL